MYPNNAWYAVLDASAPRSNKPLVARRFGLDLVFWRDASGAPQCVLDRCPHRGASLGAGRVRDGQIECPFHGFRWDGEGACVAVPCNGPDQQRPKHLGARAFPVREAQGLIWLWWGEARADYPEPPWFPEIAAGYAHSTISFETGVGWMRNVENQLDWPHLPFLHHNTIGIASPKRLEVGAELRGDRLDTWVVDDPRPEYKISLMFPNLWLNPFGGARVLGFIAFVPVDATHSLMLLRTYVRQLPIPGLARVVAAVMNLFNRVIVGQDLRVVDTQPPGETTDMRRVEALVHADLPIALFRKQVRRRALAGAGQDPELVQVRAPATRQRVA